MGLILECVDHQDTGACDFPELFGGDVVCIRDVGEIIDPIAEYGQFMMHYPYRMDQDAFDFKGPIFDDMGFHHWDAWIPVCGKYVGKFCFDLIQDRGLAINGHIRMLRKIKRPDIVQPRRVVFMLMGIEHSIQSPDPFTEHLLPKIRTGVYNQAFGSYLQMNGAPQSLVPKIQ